jgi:hypothetical protein
MVPQRTDSMEHPLVDSLYSGMFPGAPCQATQEVL